MPIQHFTLFLPSPSLEDANDSLSDFPLDDYLIHARMEAARANANYYSGLRTLWSYYAETPPPHDINAAEVNQVLREQADPTEQAEALGLIMNDAKRRIEADDKVSDLEKNQVKLLATPRSA